MKKIITILIILVTISCTTTSTTETETTPIVPKNVEIILSTDRPEFDEIVVSYHDFETNTDLYGPRQFTYDSSGNQEPIIISLPDYSYSEIQGNAYRNNGLPYSLNAQIYINDELKFEIEDIGSAEAYATIFFDYTIIED
ncbi:hypothetical protein SAMN05216503_0539 [Polaribacter sp. KT25b]|uniref:hypothetical protein n=1 Tax=Polaribacter sp. KT25b TaxID=1855336 RepID=UPI00087BEEB7|nr:hypothetical protein [Polaribacter sp. KT25b]SDR70834.1 hypothetical protein SAMN05216503_0539 [Polaribacter sp. KT25b]